MADKRSSLQEKHQAAIKEYDRLVSEENNLRRDIDGAYGVDEKIRLKNKYDALVSKIKEASRKENEIKNELNRL